MRPLIQEINTTHSPETLVGRLRGEDGVVLLRSQEFDSPQARHSFVAANPFLKLRSYGSLCQIDSTEGRRRQFGNPWSVLDSLMARYEILDEVDLPFPLGGCFGFWGYDLKNFVEARLPRRAENDLELPDCAVGFHDSLIAFDHRLDKTWIVSTGLCADGSRNETRARQVADWWRERLASDQIDDAHPASSRKPPASRSIESNLSRAEFVDIVRRAQRYIRAGDIYQVNLSHRLNVALDIDGWELYSRLTAVSPAPFSAWLDCGDFQIASSSPERFLKLSGGHIQTRPIKGTRPRSADPDEDARFSYELQSSEKERAELVMITDLMRNDLGRVCEYGSVQAPDILRLERYAQVQHLVSTVEGRLRRDVTHFSAFASCFPGGSITGAPKIRAMEIIDELEPVTRGPYTGCIGYLGFNRESQLNIAIRTAVHTQGRAWFHAGAGIVADSDPAAEYDETLAKAAGFLAALNLPAAASAPKKQTETRSND